MPFHPSDAELIMFGRTLVLCNAIEQLPRGLAVLPAQLRGESVSEDELIGSTGKSAMGTTSSILVTEGSGKNC